MSPEVKIRPTFQFVGDCRTVWRCICRPWLLTSVGQ